MGAVCPEPAEGHCFAGFANGALLLFNLLPGP